MDTVQNLPKPLRDEMNNEISSTSSEDSPRNHPIKLNKYYASYAENTASDNEANERRKTKLTQRSHFKSTGNLADHSNDVNITTMRNSINTVDFGIRNSIKKFETLQIPIVGYEVMEERARFTIFKLKVEDDKRDQSWLVFRRYTDFVRLFTRIKVEQPDLILPLPGKRWFRDNFEPRFLDERVRGLQVFVNAVLAKLPNHPVVREFFCLDEPPQVLSYQPEVQAVYGALEETVAMLKAQLKQKDATIMHLQKRLGQAEGQISSCSNCNTKYKL